MCHLSLGPPAGGASFVVVAAVCVQGCVICCVVALCVVVNVCFKQLSREHCWFRTSMMPSMLPPLVSDQFSKYRAQHSEYTVHKSNAELITRNSEFEYTVQNS